MYESPAIPDRSTSISDLGPHISAITPDPLLQRAVPAQDLLSEFFWESGSDGVLRILRCQQCGAYIHPPSVPCPHCLSDRVRPEAISGGGTVLTYTVNVQQWITGQDPYVIAIVELDEQEGLRLTSNVVGCEPNTVHIGQRVAVRFVHRNDVYYPVFVAAGRA